MALTSRPIINLGGKEGNPTFMTSVKCPETHWVFNSSACLISLSFQCSLPVFEVKAENEESATAVFNSEIPEHRCQANRLFRQSDIFSPLRKQ